MLPLHAALSNVLERDRDRARRALAHAAVAEIGIVSFDGDGITDPPAGAAAGHLFAHGQASLGQASIARLRGAMSSAPNPDEIASDAHWLAQALDPAGGAVRLVAMDR